MGAWVEKTDRSTYRLFPGRGGHNHSIPLTGASPAAVAVKSPLEGTFTLLPAAATFTENRI